MKPRAHSILPGQRGFTLVEAIVVMVILGILSGVMALFISKPVQQYVDAAGRADMSDTADLALRRMARELHGALPNSIRVTPVSGGTVVEFIPAKAGGIYLDASDDDNSAPVLDFVTASNKSFTVVGGMAALPAVGDFIVVYNLGTGYTGADAYAGSNRAALDPVNPVGSVNASWGAATKINLSSNPFAVSAGSVPNASPTHRFQVATQPVAFRCAPLAAGGPVVLTRYWNYGFNANATDPLGQGSSALLADNVVSCTFSYELPANIQHGLVGLQITLTRAGSNESVTLSQQVNVENTP